MMANNRAVFLLCCISIVVQCEGYYGHHNFHHPEKSSDRQTSDYSNYHHQSFNIFDQDFDIPNTLDEKPNYFPPSSEGTHRFTQNDENDYGSNEGHQDFSIQFPDDNDYDKGFRHHRKTSTTTDNPIIFPDSVSNARSGSSDVICRTGNKQSPVALVEKDAISFDYKPFYFEGFSSKPNSMKISNDNHSVKFSFDYGGRGVPSIIGGPLKDKYSFGQFHFHWGPNNSVGSEHSINGKRFPLELHLVMYNSKFDNLSSAATQPKGLCVIGFVYEIDRRVLKLSRNPFVRHLPLVQTYRQNSDNEPAAVTLKHFFALFSLKDLVNSVDWSYLTYQGSLTTPECYETVTWILPTKYRLKISPQEMNEFRLMKDSNDNPILSNFRELQPLNFRPVLKHY